jgi:ATP adenylyltransferase
MAEFNKNLWAPWRMQYIYSLEEEQGDEGCFLCRYWNDPDADARNYVVMRTASAMAVMNRYPYTTGHLLITHAQHKADLTDLTDEELGEMTRLIRDSVTILRKALRAEGFNVGYNLGQCAGAGLPGHVHAHIVPRWSGDTNFMAVIGDTRVLPEALDKLYVELVKTARESGHRS